MSTKKDKKPIKNEEYREMIKEIALMPYKALKKHDIDFPLEKIEKMVEKKLNEYFNGEKNDEL